MIEPQRFQAELVGVQPAGASAVLLTFARISGGLATDCELFPGHIVQLDPAGEAVNPAYFAVAGLPHARPGFQLLVKRDADHARWAQTPAGAASEPIKRVIGATGPFGQPFPINANVGRDVVLAGAGTAAGPLRAALQALVQRRAEFGDIVFLLGARRPEDLPFVSEFGDWERAGVRVVPSLSAPSAAWDGARGYVQAHIEKWARQMREPALLYCGSHTMMAEIREAASLAGIAAASQHTNYGE